MIYAVIPTGNRPQEYKSVYDWCIERGINTVTIATSDEAAIYATGIIIRDDTLNISKWWNLGLDVAYKLGAEYVLVLNDDVSLPDNWLPDIIKSLEVNSGASADRGNGLIQGYAFGLNSKDRILVDENLVWWCGDDDIQRQCELKSGFAIIPSPTVENYYANSSCERMKPQIDKDLVYYTNKWGSVAQNV